MTAQGDEDMVLALTDSQTAVVGVWGFVTFVFNLWALIDLLRRPSWAFVQANKSRGLWILLLVLSWVCGVGIFVAVWYLIMVSPRVRNQQQLGSRPGFPGST